jgi:enamine deaminase RidA (YjgF/YER057c/UK114 family)
MVAAAAGDPVGGVQYSCVAVDGARRLALMAAPHGRGTFREQAGEVLAALRQVLERQALPMAVTGQTVFLREAHDQAECEVLMQECFGASRPVTSYVLQPPCCGAALALEAWAIGGEAVRVERFGPEVLAVSYDGVRWVYCAGIQPRAALHGVYPQTLDVLEQLREALERAGSSYAQVVRTWFYLGGITNSDPQGERYQELNRARSDFYKDIRFTAQVPQVDGRSGVYPASTGIGMAGCGLVGSCMALTTQRSDFQLLPLENPQQTPAYAYSARYSAQSPKFSRAVALVLGDYITTWVSGTASIVDSETRFPGDAASQTEQTIDNIQRLIAAENFARHGLPGAGAGLHDLAKIRVYLKRPEDLACCQAVCQRRFGSVPAIYARADVCRPDLLVEIEGVAFSRRLG